jgi:hypothetical protein
MGRRIDDFAAGGRHRVADLMPSCFDLFTEN